MLGGNEEKRKKGTKFSNFGKIISMIFLAKVGPPFWWIFKRFNDDFENDDDDDDANGDDDGDDGDYDANGDNGDVWKSSTRREWSWRVSPAFDKSGNF